MRIINKKYLLIILLVGIIITGVIVFKPKENIKLDNVILKQEVNNKTFAMYKEESENNYVPVEGTEFPEGYVLNVNESKCIDNNGSELNGVFSYENNSVTITSGKTTYCYLYFDKSAGLKIIESNPANLNPNQAGMYRYQGNKDVVNNNYICFGTSDKDTCLANQDKYMYRIIGIDEQSYELKLIKNTKLKEYVQWHSDDTIDIPWSESDLYKRLNGIHNTMDNIFIGNQNYYYLSNNIWLDKISKKTWLNGKNVWLEFDTTPENTYLIETGKKDVQYYVKEPLENKDLENVICYENSDSCYHYETGKFTEKIDALIGLMYLHDYYYSPIINGVNCHYNPVFVNKTNELACHSIWLYNEEGEYVIDRFGYEPRPDKKAFSTWIITGRGADGMVVTSQNNVRPVFYLKNDIQIKNESETLGTIDDPFLIN